MLPHDGYLLRAMSRRFHRDSARAMLLALMGVATSAAAGAMIVDVLTTGAPSRQGGADISQSAPADSDETPSAGSDAAVGRAACGIAGDEHVMRVGGVAGAVQHEREMRGACQSDRLEATRERTPAPRRSRRGRQQGESRASPRPSVAENPSTRLRRPLPPAQAPLPAAPPASVLPTPPPRRPAPNATPRRRPPPNPPPPVIEEFDDSG